MCWRRWPGPRSETSGSPAQAPFSGAFGDLFRGESEALEIFIRQLRIVLGHQLQGQHDPAAGQLRRQIDEQAPVSVISPSMHSAVFMASLLGTVYHGRAEVAGGHVVGTLPVTVRKGATEGRPYGVDGNRRGRPGLYGPSACGTASLESAAPAKATAQRPHASRSHERSERRANAPVGHASAQRRATCRSPSEGGSSNGTAMATSKPRLMIETPSFS